MHLRSPATMPRSKQHAAAPTLVLYVLERIHGVRDTSQAECEAADTEGPCASNHCQLTRVSNPNFPSPALSREKWREGIGFKLTVSYFQSRTRPSS